MRFNDDVVEEIEKLLPGEQERALRLVEKFYLNLARSRRHEADLLASIANGLHDPRGPGHGARDQIEKWVRDVIRDELSKRMETNVSN
jgi:hypothetical protein